MNGDYNIIRGRGRPRHSKQDDNVEKQEVPNVKPEINRITISEMMLLVNIWRKVDRLDRILNPRLPNRRKWYKFIQFDKNKEQKAYQETLTNRNLNVSFTLKSKNGENSISKIEQQEDVEKQRKLEEADKGSIKVGDRNHKRHMKQCVKLQMTKTMRRW